MTTLRWIAFIPLAIVASVVAGLLSGAAFIAIGVLVAPRLNRGAKWWLISILLMLGVFSTLGSIPRKDPGAGLAGAAMMLVALASIGFIPVASARGPVT